MSDKARLQEVFAEIRKQKKARKEIKDIFKSELEHHERYGKLKEEMDVLKAERKSIEVQVREASPADSMKLQDIEVELKANEELLSDLAFNLLMKDESVELEDEYKNKLIPQFLVKYKKEDAGATDKFKKD